MLDDPILLIACTQCTYTHRASWLSNSQVLRIVLQVAASIDGEKDAKSLVLASLSDAMHLSQILTKLTTCSPQQPSSLSELPASLLPAATASSEPPSAAVTAADSGSSTCVALSTPAALPAMGYHQQMTSVTFNLHRHLNQLLVCSATHRLTC